jgi:tetratricopeptide (TPR) repeat protein
MAVSGLEEEFRLAVRMPRLLYVKRPAPEMEPGLRRMLQEIEGEGGLTYKTFAEAGELRELLLDDLATLLTERFGDPGRDGGGSMVPVPVTGLVGRDRDVAEVASLVSSGDHRLVVLTGPGGVGKTRLALAVLEETRSHWEDGVAFADLSAVSDPSLVPEAIASALGFARQGREAPLDLLGRRLAGRHMLVVVDNFDQVLQAAPVLPELLQRAPRLHLLVTSRVVLRVRGEREWRVQPLGLVPAGGDPAEAPAVRLLVDRIRDARPGFELTGDNEAAIAELCRRLDGLPLALELAASWMRLLTPQQLLQRLDERMQRPGALADLPGRQQTMAATIEWSYQLLPQAARQLLARLTRLLDSEFLNLRVVLSWAAERQRPSGELLRRIGDAWVWLLVRGHLGGASGLSRQIESWPAGGLRSERDTMARHWLRMIALVNDGQFEKAGALIDEVLPDARRLEQPSRWAQMLMMRVLSRPYAAGSPASGEFEEALAVARDAGDPVALGYVLEHFGLFLSVDGDPARARGLHEEMLGIARSRGDDNQAAEARYGLAMDALAAGDPGPARSHLAAAARWFTDIDHRDGLARCLAALAALALHRQCAHLAARLVGAAAAVRAIGLAPWPAVAAAEVRVTSQIRAALPEAEFTADIAKGRADTAEAALARAWAALEDSANQEVKPGS